MRFTLTHQIDTTSPQKATALRDGCAQWLQDQSCQVISTSMSRTLPNWKVHGVDVTTKKPFTEQVEAETEADARTRVEEKGKPSKVVALVQRGNGA